MNGSDDADTGLRSDIFYNTFILYKLLLVTKIAGDWGLGIGDWVLGIR